MSVDMMTRCVGQAPAKVSGSRRASTLRRGAASALRTPRGLRHPPCPKPACARRRARRRRRTSPRGHRAETRATRTAGCPVLGVVAGERFEDQRGIGERACKRADMVERERQDQCAVTEISAMRRLDAIDAAERRRPDHRTVGLLNRSQAESCRRPPPPQSRRTSRRAYVRDRADCGSLRVEIGAFGGHRLADDHRSGRAQACLPPCNRAPAGGP